MQEVFPDSDLANVWDLHCGFQNIIAREILENAIDQWPIDAWMLSENL